MTLPNPQRHVVPTTVLTKSKLVPLTAARSVTTAVSHPHVTRPRPAKTVVTKPHSPPRRNINRSGPTWLFDIDTLTKSMNYQPVTAGNQSNPNAGVQEQFDTEKAREDNVQQYVIFPLWSSGFNDPQNTDGDATFEVKEPEFEVEKPDAAGPSNTDVSPTHGKSSNMDPSQYPDDPNMLALEDITYSDDEEDVDQGGLTQINNEDFHTCMFACFISQEEPKRVHQALKDPSWIEAMQEELLQFKMQKVWILVDLPNGKRAIGTKWVLRNKKDERGIVVKNKA
nr:putative ribonuclease H-like domain-containing protein [Tanacetum cinerariifolium]